tara:strand:- start:5904 stop:6605 length:702 start_codon:yes stop_codon:yes gene_type:complete
MARIQILGPYNSGTNLIHKILNSSSNEKISIGPEGSTFFWKHNFQFKKIFKFIKKNKDVLFICMYRDIFQWINSIFKYNYGVEGMPNHIYSRNKIIRVSSKKNTGNPLQLHKPCRVNGYYFRDLIHLHKFYLFNYLKLITRFENVICISYSNLLLPNRFNYLSEKLIKFNITLNKINLEKIIQKPAKAHGDPVKNIEQAIEKNKNINNKFSEKDLKYIKKRIDHKLIDFFMKQ